MRQRILSISLLLTAWAEIAASQVNFCKLFQSDLASTLYSQVVVVDEDNSGARDSVEAALKYLESNDLASVNNNSEILLTPGRPDKSLLDGKKV